MATRTESPVRLAAETWESLFRAQVAVMRRLQAGPAFKGLAINEYDVLFTLSRCPSGWLRQNELNDHVLLSQSSLSRLVERLEKRGLVERMPAPDDGRGVLVRLTEAGLELQKQIGREHVRDIAALVGPALIGGRAAGAAAPHREAAGLGGRALSGGFPAASGG